MTDIPRAKPYLGDPAAEFIQNLGPVDANRLVEELEAIPALEQASASVTYVPGTKERYRALVVPSGYMIVYRKLLPGEVPGADDGGYLVADIEPMTARDTPRGLRHLFK
jgi:hypothetical protein